MDSTLRALFIDAYHASSMNLIRYCDTNSLWICLLKLFANIISLLRYWMLFPIYPRMTCAVYFQRSILTIFPESLYVPTLDKVVIIKFNNQCTWLDHKYIMDTDCIRWMYIVAMHEMCSNNCHASTSELEFFYLRLERMLFVSKPQFCVHLMIRCEDSY